MALTLLGMLARDRGDLTPARSYLERALAIRMRALGSDHPDVTMTLMPLANVYRGSGNHEPARRLLERVLQIQEKAFGQDHLQVAYVSTYLARSVYECGRPVDARRICDPAAAILRSPTTPRDPTLHRSLYNLACVSALTGERERALQLLGEAVEGGFPFPLMAADPDLNALHGDRRFEDILARVRARVAPSTN